MKFDDVIVNHIGEFGIYQKTQLFLLCLPSLITSINALSWTFAGADVLHRCRLGTEEVDSHNYWTAPNESFNLSCKDIKTHPEWPKCPYDKCVFQNGTKCTETGNGFIFDRSFVSYSAVERWEFVCDWSVLKAVIQSTYYVGQMAGSLVFGFLGDRIGRRYVFFIALVLQIIGTAGLAVSPHWLLYGLFRICAFTGIFFALGQVLLGALAYFVRDYQLLHTYVTIPAIFFLSYWWIVPESARWLISQKRYDEADKVLRAAARINGRQLPERWWQDIDDYSNIDSKDSRPARKHNYLDLVRTPKMRTISLATFFCWPVVSMVYYGMSMKTDFLGGDMYITFIFGGFVEIPALLVMFSIVDYVGRKPIICCGYSVAAICMLSNIWLNSETAHISVSIAQFLIGKAAITSTYATLYTITPELFPTVIRNMATGVCSLIARIGAITASFLMMWLVQKFDKTIVVYPFATLAFAAAFIVYFFLHETTGLKFSETIEEAEQKIHQVEMQPLAQKEIDDEKKNSTDEKDNKN